MPPSPPQIPFVGVDLVHVLGFREQLDRPGSTFETVFTAQELRVAASRPDRAEHLAGRWAAKEAFIKAWSQSLYGRPPVMGRDAVDFSDIEVVPDRWRRVAYRLRGEVAAEVGGYEATLSISHDGSYAIAVCNFLPH